MDVGEPIGGPDGFGLEAVELAAADSVGEIARGSDEEDLGGGMPLGVFGAEELVATPDVVPGFEGEKDKVRGHG